VYVLVSSMSVSSAVSSEGTIVPTPVGESLSGSPTSIAIPPAVSSGSGSSFILPASSDASLSVNQYLRDGSYKFRGHDVVTWASRYFLCVELHSVKITIAQCATFGVTTTDPFKLRQYRFGISPSDIATSSGGKSVVDKLPRLNHFSMTTVGSQAEVTYGPGGLSFPPGVQLDLKPVQFRANYPQVLVVCLNPDDRPTQVGKDGKTSYYYTPEGTVDLLHVHVDFEIKVSMPGFGGPTPSGP
jgi:hypothetical protein